ncbi:MGT family glycosyltransferase [Ureibacillus xyleni]|uniref:MGT family glycosyltransferase n=1 Tax=Ureibacillus xyleni TaxID=614648 RepID=A0A285SEW3_9BACL|nr:macrolide family glycosyltransferase [Ureibacillus xyleni]SOC05837.1 MGT family glycosyltransferase [Ureibacillus xyleni]
MSKIVFFSIPAHGHTNPTIPVVSELVKRGHEVWYYSFNEFQTKIERSGATFISCDDFLPSITEKEIARKAGKDFASLIEMVIDTTIALEDKVCKELKELQPDCIVSDSLCLWGKLFAKKLSIPFVCSTTSFAFNQHTAKLMKRGIKEIINMLIGMPRIHKKIQLLKSHGYQVENFVSIIENDKDTNTIVYTTKEFQPMAQTFSEKFTFVGPSIENANKIITNKSKKVIYISLGTVINQNYHFYRHCIEAFTKSNYEVIMSVGDHTNIASLGRLPDHFTVKNSVNQIEVLQKADVFITHCGMNSVSESLYFGVPMIVYPFHSEQKLVAKQVEDYGAGVRLTALKASNLVNVVEMVFTNDKYKKNAVKLSESFRSAGGAKKAADVILQVAQQ